MMNRERMRSEGFTDDEIDTIDAYCNQKEEAGDLDNTATPIICNGRPLLVCATVAEAIFLFTERCYPVRITRGSRRKRSRK